MTEDKQSEGLRMLKDIKNLNHYIEELQEQIDNIYTILTSTTVKPKDINIMTSSDPDPMSTRMAKILEYQEKLQEYQTELCARKVIVLELIRSMDIEEQRVLCLRYLQGYSVEYIGELIGYTYRWTWEKLHKAEEHFIELYENKMSVAT